MLLQESRHILSRYIFYPKDSPTTLLSKNLILVQESRHILSRDIFCPKEEKSWRKWQFDKPTNETSNYKSKLNLPKTIREIIKSIFQDLSKFTSS